MAGFTVNEGLDYIASVVYAAGSTSTLKLGLFTNVAGDLGLTSQWADVTQPSGSGYAEIDLATGSFSVTDGVVTYPQQSFTASSDWSPGDVYGYYVRTASGILVHAQYRDDGVFQMTEGRVFTVDLGIDTS